jgi:hypothetical protein
MTKWNPIIKLTPLHYIKLHIKLQALLTFPGDSYEIMYFQLPWPRVSFHIDKTNNFFFQKMNFVF